MKKVVIMQHRLLHYRIGLFERLRERCLERGILFHLVHGQPTRQEERKRDVGSLPWADVVHNRYIELRLRDIVWQPFPQRHCDADLVVMMQENRLLSNYPWLFNWGMRKTRLGYWGHGRNYQSDFPSGWRERWKKMLISRVDWWFAYTDMTRQILLNGGYPDDRISVLDNAIDNENFQRELTAVLPAQLSALREEIGVDGLAPIGLFCGSLYPDKLLGFMIEAADRIYAALPDFRLVVIGDGPGASEIQAAAKSRPWLNWVGVRKGAEKAAYFRLASVVLNPGLVGLHVLDSFCSGVPMITTPDARHSPEIAYLKDGVNGLVVAGGVSNYADAIIQLLRDPTRLAGIRQASLQDAQRYTLDNMVNNFVDGIERCLALPRKS